MASEQQMKNPLLVGRAIRAQLENEVPQDLPLERDFREDSGYTITDQYVSWPAFRVHERLFTPSRYHAASRSCTRASAKTPAHSS